MSSINEGHQSSAILLRRRLASELRRLREDAGLTAGQVAAHLYCSTSKISRIETARVTANVRDVRDMLKLYGVTGQQQEALLQLPLDARRKEDWWHTYVNSPDVRTYVGFEKSASLIRTYGALLIPGLLQCEEYARRVITVLFPNLDSQEVQHQVQLRMKRQALLIGDDAPLLEVVVDEAALGRLVGGREVMRKQLHRLVEAAHMPKVQFQVIPYEAEEHGGMLGPFTILIFPNSADPEMVHLEHPTGDLFLSRLDEIKRYGALFDQLQKIALTPQRSIALLTDPGKQHLVRC